MTRTIHSSCGLEVLMLVFLSCIPSVVISLVCSSHFQHIYACTTSISLENDDILEKVHRIDLRLFVCFSPV